MKKIGIAILASMLVLSACGKRTDDPSAAGLNNLDANGEPVDASGVGAPVDPALGAAITETLFVSVITSEASLLTGGGKTAEIKALVTNEDKQALEGKEVSFSTTGGVLQNAESVTNESGEAIATLSLTYDPANQPITVTVKSGEFVGSVRVIAQGSELTLAGEAPTADGKQFDIVATLLAGDGSPIADRQVSISTTPVVDNPDAFNSLSATALKTDPQGNVRVTVGTDEGAGTVTFTALPDGEGTPTVKATYAFNDAGESVNPLSALQEADIVNVRVISSEASLETGGKETAEITALITSNDNKAMAGVPVSFSSSGGVLQNEETVTNETGEAKATLSLIYDPANQPITVTVKSGEYEGSVRVIAEGSTLSLTGVNSVVPGKDVEIVAILTAGNGEPIADRPVVVESSAGNALSTQEAKTDPDGIVKVSVDTAAGDDTITFTALRNADDEPTVAATHTFTVASDQIAFDPATPSELAVNKPHDITVRLSTNDVPLAGVPLRFTITAGQLVGAQNVINTDANGEATVTVLSSTAGPAALTAVVEDGSLLSNKHVLNFVGDEPASLQLSTTSSRVPTGDQATLSAIITDANGNPVKNTEVQFSSANLKGGQLNPSTGVTDENGEATTVFSAGTTATQEDEIVVVSEVVGTNINGSVSLTVAEPVLNVTIGSSNKIVETAFKTQNRVSYVVQVADGGGQPIADAEVQLSIEPINYSKGELYEVDKNGIPAEFAPDPASWIAAGWAKIDGLYSIECASEDVNGNRILDAGEDTNSNGSLDPQDPASLTAVADTSTGVATIVGNGRLTTDASGSGYFDLLYPVSNALWAKVTITARAQELGAEAEDSYVTRLLMSAEEANNTQALPANHTSPYGVDLDCTNLD